MGIATSRTAARLHSRGEESTCRKDVAVSSEPIIKRDIGTVMSPTNSRHSPTTLGGRRRSSVITSARNEDTTVGVRNIFRASKFFMPPVRITGPME